MSTPEIKELITSQPVQVVEFFNETFRIAEENGVFINLSPARSVGDEDGGKGCNGYFTDGEEPILACACGQPFEDWLLVFIHESSHMDQWIEQIPEWTNSQLGEGYDFEVMDLVDLWCEHKIELSDEQLNKYIFEGREVELDCEKRSVEKIQEYDLPVDVSTYIQKANAYVWFYTMIKETRSWYQIGKEPYNIEKVWKNMPTKFQDDYDFIPDDIRKLFLEIL